MTALTFLAKWIDQGVSKGIKSIGNDLDDTGRKTGAFRKHAGAMFAAAGVAAVAFGVSSVKAYSEAEQAQTKLEDAFARFPAMANTNIEALRNLNKELAAKTRFDDDALASGQAVLAQFKLTGTQVRDLTPLLADYAAKTGKDLPTAAETLGKAFLGNTRALKELGINYKSTGDQAKDTENIIRLLRGQVGGFAEVEGKTAAGQAAILKNQFGELQEEVGAKLMPVLIKLAEVGLKALAWIDQNKEAAVIIGGITAAIWLLNLAMAANPAVLIAAGIALLVAGLIILWTKSAAFRDYFIGMWESIKVKISGVVAGITFLWDQYIGSFIAGAKRIAAIGPTLFNTVKEAAIDATRWAMAKFDELVRWCFGLPGRIGQAVAGVFSTLISPFAQAIGWVMDRINGLVGWINARVRDAINAIASIGRNAGIVAQQIPLIGGLFRAAGGPVRAGQSYVVGEQGPEIFKPSMSGTIIPNGATAGMRASGAAVVNIHFSGPIGSPHELRQWLTRALDDLRRRGRA